MTDDNGFEKLLREVKADKAAKKLRLDSPYLIDLIEVFKPHKNVLSQKPQFRGQKPQFRGQYT